MKLLDTIANQLVDDLAAHLNGGSLRISDAPPNGAFSDSPLVSLPLRTPAFSPAVHGRAMALTLEKAKIERSGYASYGELVTAAGDVIATLTVASNASPDAQAADVLIMEEDTYLRRGGLCETISIVLRLPLMN